MYTVSGGNWGSEQPLANVPHAVYKETHREHHLWTKLLTEFIGDFIFVTVGSLQAVSGAGTGMITAAFAHGITIFVLVASLGHISGGHFNPAVSLSVAASRKMPLMHLPFYMFFQVFGGIVGAFFVRLVLKKRDYDNIFGGMTMVTMSTTEWWQAIIIEGFLTFVLCQTVLNSAVDTDSNMLAPLAIGFTLTLDILACGFATGASMNPARSFGPSFVAMIFGREDISGNKIATSFFWQYHYVYWIGPFCGALLAALIYRVMLSRNHRLHIF